jgi:SAM-dependent methyltransferase
MDDILWDYRNSVSTRRLVPVKDLGLHGASANQAHAYETPRVGHLRDGLRTVPQEQRHHLVDFGSGLGRILVLARELGYARVSGVELSDALCAEARENIARLTSRRGQVDAMEILLLDAADYLVPSSANVLYFYNPFGPRVLERVLDNIKSSIDKKPREAWIMYVNAVHKDVMRARSWLEEARQVRSQGYDSVVFRVLANSRESGER